MYVYPVYKNVVHVLLVYHTYEEPGIQGPHASVAPHIIFIVLHSFPAALTILATGKTLFHVYVAYHVVSFHALSLTFARIPVDVGSACDDNEYSVVVVQAHRLVQFVLNAYGVECNHAHHASAPVALNEPADHSFHEPFVNCNVGTVISFRIINVFELVVHHTSDILMVTFVVPAIGVNVNDKLLELFIHDHHVLYSTAVLGHHVAVSLILHVVDHA